MQSSQLVLFDIDGTLLHAGGSGRRAFSLAFQELFGVPEAYQNIVARGRTDLCLIEEISYNSLGRALNPKECTELKGRYIHYFLEEVSTAELFRVMPGAASLVKQLATLPNLFLGIETGNFRETALAKLNRAEIGGFFKAGGFGCDSRERSAIVQHAIARMKDATERQFERIVVIGDAAQDITAAKENGCEAILVLTGGTPRDHDEALKADLIVEDFSDPRPLIEFLSTY
jgi:phosphoglycolate phosphatase-like HAD superfamily hydrolase